MDDAQGPPAVEVEVEKAVVGHPKPGIHPLGDDVLVITTELEEGVGGMAVFTEEDALKLLKDELEKIVLTEDARRRDTAFQLFRRLAEQNSLEGEWTPADRRFLWDTAQRRTSPERAKKGAFVEAAQTLMMVAGVEVKG